MTTAAAPPQPSPLLIDLHPRAAGFDVNEEAAGISGFFDGTTALLVAADQGHVGMVCSMLHLSPPCRQESTPNVTY